MEMHGLIDRVQDVTQLRQLLESSRLVALVGPGGIGKTTLARHIVSSYAEDFPGGIHFVEGYEIGRGAEQTARFLLGEIRGYGHAGRTLLVIDNIDELHPYTAADLLAHATRAEGDLRIRRCYRAGERSRSRYGMEPPR